MTLSVVTTPSAVALFSEIARLDKVAWGGDPSVADGDHAWRVWCEHAFVAAALEHGKLVGVLLGLPTTDRAVEFLHKLFVAEGHRASGVGRRLMAEYCEHLDANGFASQLTTAPTNAAMIRLCSGFLFEPDRVEEAYYGPGKDRLVLRRAARLDPPAQP
jgi:GNAT superfamily N-acetyltransferase